MTKKTATRTTASTERIDTERKPLEGVEEHVLGGDEAVLDQAALAEELTVDTGAAQ